MMYANLDQTESDLTGAWLESDGIITGDKTSERIGWLIRERLMRLASDGASWTALFRDPADGRLWELSYPHSEWDGGGPPRLAVISRAEAAMKYGPSKV
jgi:hypothetical protein